MITEEHTFTPPDTYPLNRLGEPDKLLFFDIETTGFSGDFHQIYLIGCTFCRRSTWHLIQWFADTADAEKEVLTAFYQLLQDFHVLVHYNGDSFDLPFLLKRFCAHSLAWDFSEFVSIDIYKRIRPFRNMLGLENLKQKSVEHFLGIFRQDPYSGGQLIDVYRFYLESRETDLYQMLMLHNREDLEGMPLILPILYYTDFFRQDFALQSQNIREVPDIFGEMTFCLCLTLEGRDKLPVPVQWETSHASCQACGELLELTVPLINDTLKYFYPDYKDYYYLIYEDTAVHKSVGEYVEKEARRKATAQTCYTKKTALFLPQPDALWSPAFKKEYKQKQSYAEYRPALLENHETLMPYLSYLLEL